MIARRQCLALIASTMWVNKRVFAEGDESVEFSWRVGDAHREFLTTQLKVEPTQPEDEKGLFIFIFAGIVALPYLADAVLKLRDRLVTPGIKIDARGKKILIETDSTLPKGHILLVDKSGGKLYPPGEIKDPTTLVEKLTAH